jgi:hypothetical protein
MPSTDRKLELKAKTSVAQTASQAAVYANGLKREIMTHTYVKFYTTMADSSELRAAAILLPHKDHLAITAKEEVMFIPQYVRREE